MKRTIVAMVLSFSVGVVSIGCSPTETPKTGMSAASDTMMKGDGMMKEDVKGDGMMKDGLKDDAKMKDASQ